MTATAAEYVALKPTDGSDDPWWACLLRRCRTAFDFVIMAMLAAIAVFIIFFLLVLLDEKNVAEFSMDLAAVDGLNGTVGRTVSPGFGLTVKVANPRTWQAWCSDGGEVVVSYAGVSLAWGRVPSFCVARKGTAELTAAASGRGVGLSDDLRRRFATEWSTSTASVVAEMKLFYDGNGWPCMYAYRGVSLIRRGLALQGKEAPDA
ncbi:hypothetical protein ACP70R_036907 [Stipagrostis hirtigluma subsp. patula]